MNLDEGQKRREAHAHGQLVPELLLNQIADHALGLRVEDVEWIHVDVLVRRALEREESNLRPVSMRDHELVRSRDRRKRAAGALGVRTLVLGRELFAALKKRIATESDNDAHR